MDAASFRVLTTQMCAPLLPFIHLKLSSHGNVQKRLVCWKRLELLIISFFCYVHRLNFSFLSPSLSSSLSIYQHISLKEQKRSRITIPMIIPVRCFTCGSIIGDKYQLFLDIVSEGYTEEDAMNALNLHRFCCRRMMLTHVDLTDLLLKFNPADNNELFQPTQ
eukprot:gene4256-3078_t